MSDPYNSDNYDPEQGLPDLRSRRPATERIPQSRIADYAADDEADKTISRRTAEFRRMLDVPWWGFAAVIAIVGVITCGLWWVVLRDRGSQSTLFGPTPTPIIVVITATPTLGASFDTPPPVDDQPDDLLLPTITPTLDENLVIQVGRTIRIAGTEGDGLSLRQGPGLSYTTLFIGHDDELFQATEGPSQADGYTWWYLVSVNDPAFAGWAVDIYLEVAIP